MNNTVEEAIGGYVAEENKVAAASVVDELPSREDVENELMQSEEGIQRVEIMIAVNSYNEGVTDTLDTLIARGWLRVRES